MKKRILCLAMMAVMALGIPMNVSAVDAPITREWGVVFDGSKMATNYADAEAMKAALEMLPGDTLELTVKLENGSNKKTDWYMQNEVLKTLEEDGKAQGGAYTYTLSYIDPKGTATEIYNSDRVGGENDTLARATAEEGLKQVKINQEEEHIYLDRLNNGEKAYVKLTVSLDGETQGNDYQETLAKLMLNFAAETVTENNIVTIEKVEQFKTVVVERPVVAMAAKTGDAAPIAVFSAVALTCGIVLMAVAMKQMKERRQKGE